MIRSPHPGQRIRLHYRRSTVGYMPHHGKDGTVLFCAHGRGPRNALVRLDDGVKVVVARGNLVAIAEPTEYVPQPPQPPERPVVPGEQMEMF